MKENPSRQLRYIRRLKQAGWTTVTVLVPESGREPIKQLAAQLRSEAKKNSAKAD